MTTLNTIGTKQEYTVLYLSEFDSTDLVSVVRHFSQDVKNDRTFMNIHEHMRSEVQEVGDEVYVHHVNDDNLIEESIDVIACALDMIFQVNPDITDAELGAIMLRKCQKWKSKYS